SSRHDGARLQRLAAARQKVGEPEQRPQWMAIRMAARMTNQRTGWTGDRNCESLEWPLESAFNARPQQKPLIVDTVGQEFRSGKRQWIHVARAKNLQHQPG